MNNFSIKEYSFDKNIKLSVSNEKKAKDWPVVYVIHNDKELYVGETQNAMNRMQQHWNNVKRKKLKQVKIIFDDEYNKSAILDIEQSLIQLFSADQKFKLQNENGGQSEKHNYYQREKYLNKVDDIWNWFMKKHLADNSCDDLKNTDLFKYSPYNSLTSEQNEVCREVIKDIINQLSKNEKGLAVIRGGAGTGKTIVLTNMIYKLVKAGKIEIDFSKEDDELTAQMQIIHDLKKFSDGYGELKIGYVVPMTSIRKTLKTVFSKTGNGLKANMVIGPFDVFKDDYDVVFVDEAHRLAQYKNIGFRGTYKKCAEMIGRNPEDTTQLEMILKRSKYCVLVYDEKQTVKGSDITEKQFKSATNNVNHIIEKTLTTQMRCLGGELYTDYIEKIFSHSQKEKLKMDNYDFYLYYDVDRMINDIKELDKKYKLCRNAAGYSWEWISKGIGNYKDVINQGKEDITIQGHKYVWNMTNKEFILSNNAVNEIGCIHTLQGYDLNYAGVILGEEIYYDKATKQIEIELDKFYDKYVKQESSYDKVKEFIINSYKVMLTRGIKGTFVYVCDDALREYLKEFIEVKK